MKLYINGNKVDDVCNTITLEHANNLSDIMVINIIEDKNVLSKTAKNGIHSITSIEQVRSSKPHSYVMGKPSGRVYCTPVEEMVTYWTDEPVPVYKLRYTDEAWQEYGCDELSREFEWSLPKILYYINQPEAHSDQWTDYDETDWVEGLDWDNMYEPVSTEPVRYE